MPEIVSCPQCQRQLRIPDELLGSSVKCPSCGTTFIGTAASAAPQPGAFVDEPNQGRAPAPPPPDAAYPKMEFEDYRGPRGDQPPLIRRDGAPHRGVLILVLGILSLVVCAVTGPFAWILGNKDLAEMRAGRMDREGEGMTRAGQICGIIGSVLLIIQCGFGMLYLVIIGAVVAGGAR